MQKEIFTFKIGGESGGGQQLMGLILSKAFIRSGFYAYDASEYESRIRGGLSTYQSCISRNSVNAVYKKLDLVVAFNKEAFEYCLPDLLSGGVLVYDPTNFSPDTKTILKNKLKIYALPLKDILKDYSFKPIVSNFIAIGALAYLLGLDAKILEKTVIDVLHEKPIDLISNDLAAMKQGYEFAKNNFPASRIHPAIASGKKTSLSNKKVFLTANEASALSATAFGCSAFFAYPMSPATSILQYMAKWADKTGILVKQAYDEIEVVHMALGASFAGARVLTATSGGGFALMAEAISESAMAEVPMVVIDSQRPGPATGLPTWTEQGDLQFAANIGHGDLTRIVLAPGDAGETFYMLGAALNISEKYQIPVVVLLDKSLSDGHATIEKFDKKKIKVNRGKLLTEKDLKNIKNYKRYALTKDGVSKRSLPGQKNGIHIANSDEHDEHGYTIEGYEPKIRIAQMKKRAAKLGGILKDLPKPVLYGKKTAKRTIVGWGSVKGPVLEALKYLPENKYNFLHFTAVAPLDEKYLKNILNKKKEYYLVENNMTGQFGDMLQRTAGIVFKKKIVKYDGSQFFPEEIIEQLQK
jgi:2-oxoglutarate ferredoxin oxidoreductase subunit alpha